MLRRRFWRFCWYDSAQAIQVRKWILQHKRVTNPYVLERPVLFVGVSGVDGVQDLRLMASRVGCKQHKCGKLLPTLSELAQECADAWLNLGVPFHQNAHAILSGRRAAGPADRRSSMRVDLLRATRPRPPLQTQSACLHERTVRCTRTWKESAHVNRTWRKTRRE